MIAKSLSVQTRVVGALVFRLMKSEHGTTGLGYLSAFLKPIGQILMLSTIFGFMSRNLPLGDNYIIFLASGVIPYHLCVTIINKVMGISQSGKPLFGHPMITPLDLSIAVLILESGILLIVSAVILISVGLLGLWNYEIDSLLTILMTIVTAIGIGYGVGLINLSISIKLPSYTKIWQLLSMPLFIISGIFFTSEGLPDAILEYLYYNPLFHITDSMRSGIYRSWNSDFADSTYMLNFVLISVFLGLLFQRLTDKKVRE